jgi:3'(2'), 5'-bisphosphate nucleotidase
MSGDIQADYKIQSYLIKGIAHFFPKLRVIGEESVEYTGHIELDFESILLEEFPQEGGLEESVPVSELCLWIDPIDNTQGFIKGKLEGVTILVGMARKCQAYLGIIASPYCIEQGSRQFKPCVRMGFAPAQKAFRSWGIGNWVRMERPKGYTPFRLCTSRRVNNDPVGEIAKEIKSSQPEKFGGSGNKVLLRRLSLWR